MQEGRDWNRLVIRRKDTTGEEQVIGHSQIRKGGIAKVTGTAQYGADVDLPGQLYAAVTRSPYPHARILKIDISQAEVMPGVRAVIFPIITDRAEITTNCFHSFLEAGLGLV